VVKAIVDKTGVKATDVVLEIGPGTGNLTNLLLQQAKKVIAIEVDPRMARCCRSAVAARALDTYCTSGTCVWHAARARHSSSLRLR
jgi:16S rRNA A1518/A1519 N6-dimethyltransferase RsmA/KsgA/DIM1 with predicted DNA glycosylase/AP lyase activity